MTTTDVQGHSGQAPREERAAPPRKRKPWPRIVTLPNVLTLIFFALCTTFILRHALWRDEAQAWLIARDSRSLGELFWNLRYEGHSPLWHMLLWLITRFTVNPVAMQMLHALLATATVYLVTRFAPFPLIARVLFPFGYFPLFEYGLISRNYQLILLLALAACAMWAHRRQAYVRIGLLLGLLSLSHVQGIILAAAFGKMMLFDVLATRKGRSLVRKNLGKFVTGIMLALALTGWSVKSLIPPADYSYARGWQADILHEHNIVTWYTLWNGLVPVAKNSPAPAGQPEHSDFWGNNFIRVIPGEAHPLEIAAKWAPVIGLAMGLLVITSWRGVLFFEVAAIGLLLFAHLKLGQLYDIAGGARHHGAYFIAVVMACWIAWRGKKRWPALGTIHWQGWAWRGVWVMQRGLLTALLLVHVYAAWLPMRMAWNVPMSNGRATAEAIRPQLHAGEVLVCPTGYMATPVVAYLPGHPVYLVDESRWGSYAVWRQITAPRQDPVAAAQRIARERNESVIFISPYSPRRIAGAQTLAEFGGPAIQVDERYFIYRIPAPSAPPRPERPN